MRRVLSLPAGQCHCLPVRRRPLLPVRPHVAAGMSASQRRAAGIGNLDPHDSMGAAANIGALRASRHQPALDQISDELGSEAVRHQKRLGAAFWVIRQHRERAAPIGGVRHPRTIARVDDLWRAVTRQDAPPCAAGERFVGREGRSFLIVPTHGGSTAKRWGTETDNASVSFLP